MSVRLRGALPKDDRNGLAHLEGALAANPDRLVVVVALMRPDVIAAALRNEKDPRVVYAALLHVEALTAADADQAERMLRGAYEERTGKVVLPFWDEA